MGGFLSRALLVGLSTGAFVLMLAVQTDLSPLTLTIGLFAVQAVAIALLARHFLWMRNDGD